MSINLVTDGMLYPIFRIEIPSISAPCSVEGSAIAEPNIPCAPIGEPTNAIPPTPMLAAAEASVTPSIPCGASGYDPTINPPTQPVGNEGSEIPGTEAPDVPKCPEGESL